MTLADLIEKRRDEIAEVWLGRVRERLGRIRVFTDEQVIDSLSIFLPEVVVALRSPKGAPAPSYVAQAHGGQRHVLGADIGEVVLEYSLLFEVIASIAGSHEELSRLAAFLFSAAADAAQIVATENTAALRRRNAEHFAFVAHEIRNPLISARLAAELLRKTREPRALDALDRSLSSLVGVVDQSLSDAKASSGVEPQRALVRLDKLVAATVADVETDAHARNIALEVQPLELEVNADARLVRSALTNVVSNAIKFSPGGSTVRVDLRRERNLALISVTDRCGGLPPGKAEILFKAFYQAGTDRTGFGLGLAIARQAIEAHKGTIRVQDDPGRGCTFVIELPIT